MAAREILDSLCLQEDISLCRARVKRCLATIIRLPMYLRGVRGKDNARVPLARFERCAQELDATLQSFAGKPSVHFDSRLAHMAKYVLEYYQWASAYLRARKVRMKDLQIWRQFETDAGSIMGMVAEREWDDPEEEEQPEYHFEQVAFAPGGPETDAYLYHVTSAENAERIEEIGFQSSPSMFTAGSYSAYSRGKMFLTERGGVTFWRDRVEEQMYHNFDYGEDEEPQVAVLRIERSAVEERLQPDEEGTQDSRRPCYYVLI